MERPDQVGGNKQPEHRIPGYGGYVPGVKSENLYGKTYGKTSFSSAANDFNRGIDLPVNAKFATTTAETMLDHAQGNHKTTAQIVGVHREEDCYTKPIDPTDIRKFWGCDMDDGDGIVEQKQFEANSKAFYQTEMNTPERENAGQSEQAAMAQFFGTDEAQRGQKINNPIPGYNGHSRRIGADNLFGMTYAEARNAAVSSQGNID